VRNTQRVLQRKRREDALKVRALRLHIRAGAEDIARGNFIDVDDADLEHFLEGVDRSVRKRPGK